MWVGLLAYLCFLWLLLRWTYLMAFVGTNSRDRSVGVAYFTACIMDRKVTLTLKEKHIYEDHQED